MAKILRAEVKDLGPVRRDPWAALAVGIITQAVRDLASSDPVSKMDALLWFVNPDAGELMRFAGINTDPLVWLTTYKVRRLTR